MEDRQRSAAYEESTHLASEPRLLKGRCVAVAAGGTDVAMQRWLAVPWARVVYRCRGGPAPAETAARDGREDAEKTGSEVSYPDSSYEVRTEHGHAWKPIPGLKARRRTQVHHCRLLHELEGELSMPPPLEQGRCGDMLSALRAAASGELLNTTSRRIVDATHRSSGTAVHRFRKQTLDEPWRL